MRKTLLLLLMVVVLALLCLPAMAQSTDQPTLGLRSVTLVPLTHDASVEGGVVLDLHLIPKPVATDKWYLWLQDKLARHTAFSWAQTATDLSGLSDISKGSPGISVSFSPPEADVYGGVVWKQDNHLWYIHLSFKYK